MARYSVALARRVVRFFAAVTAIATALGAGSAVGQIPASKGFSERYKEAVNIARELIWDIDDYAFCEDYPSVKQDFDASRQRLKGLIAEAAATGQGIAAGVLRSRLSDLEDAFDDFEDDCGGSLTLLRVRPFLEGGYVSQSATGEVQRLAHDVGGIIQYNFGNVNPTSSGGGFRVGLDVPVQRIGRSTYFIGGSYGFTSFSASARGSANGPFNIPGLGIGNNPNGFFTAANAPVSYQYESDSTRHEFDLSVGSRTRAGSVYVSPRFGGLVNVYTVDDDYMFNRPAAPTITGNYMTSSTVYTVGGYFRLDIDYRVPDSNVTLFASGRAGVDFNWADSDVALNLTSPLVETQKVSISDTKITPNLSLQGGLRFDLGAWDAYVKGGIQYGRYVPNVAIPGGGLLPVLDGETATEYSVMAGLTGDLWADWPRLGFGKAPPRLPPLLSDARLKRDIAQVGRLSNGLRLYRYRYLWSDVEYVGVMAQEVRLLMPDAVVVGADGFLRVDYGRLGIGMITWRAWLARDAVAG